MIVHYLQHVPFEGLGNIEGWVRRGAHETRVTRLFAGNPLPDVHATDLLIVLGGPMNVHEEPDFPFLKLEKRLIERFLREDKCVLGVCLGAQLIADVLGAKVYRNELEEIGWFPVKRIAEPESSPFAELFPRSFETFHWHGDTFSLPAEAKHLLSSDACANQAFAFGDRVVGLQFHLEATRESVRLMMENEGETLQEAEFVQSAAQILSPDKPFAENAALLAMLLDALTRPKIIESA